MRQASHRLSACHKSTTVWSVIPLSGVARHPHWSQNGTPMCSLTVALIYPLEHSGLTAVGGQRVG